MSKEAVFEVVVEWRGHIWEGRGEKDKCVFCGLLMEDQKEAGACPHRVVLGEAAVAWEHWFDSRFAPCTTCGVEISPQGRMKVELLDGTEDGRRIYHHEDCGPVLKKGFEA